MTDALQKLAAALNRGQQFVRARRALIESGDALSSVIMACIADGLQTRDEIVRAVPRLIGHSYAQVAYALSTRAPAQTPTRAIGPVTGAAGTTFMPE